MHAFFKFVTQDWYFAFPMLGMSVVAMTLVIWRLMLNYHARTDMNTFMPAFQDVLQKEGVEGAIKFCEAQPGVIPKKLLMAGLKTSRQGLAAMRRAMANVIELEILPDLNYLLPTILAIAKIATMVGLLGTVISMTATFAKIEEMSASAEAGKTGGIANTAGEIGLALFATALGLVTAIPLVFAHVQFKAWIANYEVKMKSAAQNFLLIMQSYKPAAAPGRNAPVGDKMTR